MGRLSRVRKIFRTKKNPFKKLLAWARRPEGPGPKSKRFATLQKWARKQRNAATGKARKAWELRRKSFRKKRRFFAERAEPEPEALPSTGVSTFDGKPVPNWIVNILTEARATGLWSGVVISGVRTTAYSIQLCLAMCGAPSCPGRCAGASSNHNADDPVVDGEGAVDVTDEAGLKRALAEIGKDGLLKNALGPADPNHFSRSGR